MPRLMATETFPYGVPQRVLKAGDEFECSAEDARILKTVGKARDLPTSPPRQTASAPETQAAVEPKSPAKPKQYNRRDMRAEG